MSEQTIYFSKVSLNSIEAYDLQSNKLEYKIVVDAIMESFVSDIIFEQEKIYKDDDGIIKSEIINYNLKITNKSIGSIEGVVYKTSLIYVKKKNRNEMKLIKSAIENTEDIAFYYDVEHEYVGFYTRRRFGRKTFNEAFEGLLNTATFKKGHPYNFHVETYTHGTSLENIKNELNAMKDIVKLSIMVQTINPDDIIKEKLEKKADELNTSKEMEEARATTRSVVYESKGLNGYLNMAAAIIKKDLDKLEDIHSEISTEELTKRGYVEVRAEDKDGEIISTADSAAYSRKINNMTEFKDACVVGISIILRKGWDDDQENQN